MKILYVEDQLSMQVDTLLSIFNDVLGENIKEDLKILINDDSGRGASAEEIKQIIDQSDRLFISDSFPDALKEITQNFNEYDLFIIDRNLSEGEYNFNDIQAIDPNLTKEIYEKYLGWEGDWLLNVLRDKIDVRNQFYFLTGYTNEDLKIDKIESLVEQRKFDPAEQLIKKGDLALLEFLKRKIKQYPAVKIYNENKEIMMILESQMGDNAVKDFIDIMENRRNIKYLNEIRQFVENNILKEIAKRLNVVDPKCYQENKKTGQKTDRININGFIYWITEKKKYTYVRLKCNEVVAHHLMSVIRICQAGSHRKTNLTEDTVQSVVYGLKDIIRWFGKITK